MQNNKDSKKHFSLYFRDLFELSQMTNPKKVALKYTKHREWKYVEGYIPYTQIRLEKYNIYDSLLHDI